MKLVIVCSFTALLLTPLHAGKKNAPPVDPKFTTITNVAVLPIIDARAGKKASVNLAKLQQQIVKLLTRKHYPASAVRGSETSGEIAIEDAESPTPQFIKKLGPASERWVLVVFLGDVTAKITFGSTGNAQIGGYLFDKEAAQFVWRANGVGQAGQGGLAGMAFKGMMKGEALDAAVGNMMAYLPNRPKPAK